MNGRPDGNAGVNAHLGSGAGVVDLRKIRKQNLPYLFIWVVYYAWVVVFTTWWTATPDTGTAFDAEFRGLIQTVNMLSSAFCVFAFGKERFALTARIGAVAVLLSLGFFLVAPLWQLKTAAAVLLGASLGCMNISVLLPFVFELNNTEKLYAIILGHAVCNALSLLMGVANDGAESLLAISILVVAFLAIPFFPPGTQSETAHPKDSASFRWPESPSEKAQGSLIANKSIRLAIVLTILASTLGAVLFLGAGKALLNISMLPADDAVLMAGGFMSKPDAVALPDTVILPWYYLGGIAGSLLYGLIFALPRGNVHMALSLPFGCLACGLLFNAFAGSVPGMATAFAFLLGMGTAIGMSTVYYVLGVVSKKYDSMFYVRLSILVIGIFGGVSAVFIGGLVGSMGQDMQISLVLTVVSSIATVLVLVFSPTIAQVCFDDAWAGNVTLPEITGLEEARQLVDQTDKLEGLNLTPREREVCMLLLKGLTIRQISSGLGLAFATVNGYYRSLYRKLGINSKAELFLRFGTDQGIDLAVHDQQSPASHTPYSA